MYISFMDLCTYVGMYVYKQSIYRAEREYIDLDIGCLKCPG